MTIELDELLAQTTHTIEQQESALRGARVNIAVISDIHLGHPKTPTEHIIRNLETYAFPRGEDTKKLDIIFIAGDIFDMMLDFFSPESVAIRRWVAKLVALATEYDIAIRILKGTPLHDWDQPYIFVEERENHYNQCDLKYIDNIHIEYMERFGIHVLYVPDESRPTPEQTWEVVEQLMSEQGISQVDYAIMHGAFPHQLPNIDAIKDRFHDPEKYLKIVRYYIAIGHIHKHSQYDRIIAQGSFDRVAHGEEGDKGHIRINHGQVEFRINKGAMRYLTLDVTGMSADLIIEKVGQVLGNDVTPGHIRLRCFREDVGSNIHRRLSDIFPYIQFTTDLSSSTPKKKITSEEATRQLKQLPVLTRDNITDELLSTIKQQAPDRYDRCVSLVENLVNVIK